MLTGDARGAQGRRTGQGAASSRTPTRSTSRRSRSWSRAGFARDDLFTVVHEQFMTDTARTGRHRAAGDHVPRAQRLLHAAAATPACSRPQAGRARRARPGPTSRSSTSCCAGSERSPQPADGLDRPRAGGRNLRPLRVRRSRRDREDRLRRPRPARGQGAFPRRLRLARRALPLPAGLAGRRAPRRATSWSATRRRCRASPTTGTSTRRPTPTHPFRLATSPSRGFLNSTFTETPGQQGAREAAEPDHPSGGCGAGSASPRAMPYGSAIGVARSNSTPACSTAFCPGTVIAEGIYPNRAHRGKKGINSLTSSQPVAPFGGAAFHDTAVWVRRA